MACRLHTSKLRTLADAERDSRQQQGTIDIHHQRMHAAADAPRNPFQFLERSHGLAEIVERGVGVQEERPWTPPAH